MSPVHLLLVLRVQFRVGPDHEFIKWWTYVEIIIEVHSGHLGGSVGRIRTPCYSTRTKVGDSNLKIKTTLLCIDFLSSVRSSRK